MATVTCRACGEPFSLGLSNCPNCNYSVNELELLRLRPKQKKSNSTLWGITLVLLSFAASFTFVFPMIYLNSSNESRIEVGQTSLEDQARQKALVKENVLVDGYSIQTK